MTIMEEKQSSPVSEKQQSFNQTEPKEKQQSFGCTETNQPRKARALEKQVTEFSRCGE
ncbi:BnaCnng33110D [Brassica napus]|uniref:BnaCnng33110D protein n=1 Tax=Brassica napus TaxID=3708 RepID=A0A078J643_BRANA|nr:BnaCnng33110D [Brassica napus]